MESWNLLKGNLNVPLLIIFHLINKNFMHILEHATYSNFCEKFFFIGRKNKHMNNDVIKLSTKIESNAGGTGYKVIEINVTDPSENLFAVVTPVKMK
jgi:hypothetical protein